MKITKDILDAALAGDWQPLRDVPKTDLHAHLLLSCPFQTYMELTNGKLQAPPARFTNLDTFLEYVKSNFFPLFNSMDAYTTVIQAALEHMIADGIVYTEASYDVAMPLLVGMNWTDFAKEMQRSADEFEGRITLAPELGLARDFEFDGWLDLVKEALDTGFFKSVDLYGAETLKDIGYFDEYFELARQYQLKVKIHSGEAGSAARTREEFRLVKPDGIQHGVMAYTDTELMRMLADARIDVNVCPWSNYLLSIVDEYERHPIRQLFDAGIRVTINSDDYSVFQRSVSEEYAMLYKCGLFTPDELETIRGYGLEAAPSQA